MIINIVGQDPSLKNWGFAKAKLDVDTLTVMDVELHLVQTEPTKDKKLRKNSDDLDRSRKLYDAIQKHTADTAISFVEVPHGSQSARAMASYGTCIGLIPSIQSFSLIQLSEQQLKIATLGRKTGTKEEAINWAVGKHPDANWLRKGTRLVNANEHLADALAAIYAGMQTEDFKNSIAMLRYMQKAA